MKTETIKVGKRGTIVIPAGIRHHYGFDEGTQVLVEASSQGILLRPMVSLPIERYSRERKAEFLLNNAVTSEDYAAAVEKVRKMGLDPDVIPHEALKIQ